MDKVKLRTRHSFGSVLCFIHRVKDASRITSILNDVCAMMHAVIKDADEKPLRVTNEFHLLMKDCHFFIDVQALT